MSVSRTSMGIRLRRELPGLRREEEALLKVVYDPHVEQLDLGTPEGRAGYERVLRAILSGDAKRLSPDKARPDDPLKVVVCWADIYAEPTPALERRLGGMR